MTKKLKSPQLKKQQLTTSSSKSTSLLSKLGSIGLKYWIIIILIIVVIVVVAVVVSVVTKEKKKKNKEQTPDKNVVDELPPENTNNITQPVSVTTPSTTQPEVLPTGRYECIFDSKYFYINNYQSNFNSKYMNFKNMDETIFVDVKFSNPGKYQVFAYINIDINDYVDLQTGIKSSNPYLNPMKITRVNRYTHYWPKYVYVGDVILAENDQLIQPVFIRNKTSLEWNINVIEIKIVGNSPIDYAYKPIDSPYTLTFDSRYFYNGIDGSSFDQKTMEFKNINDRIYVDVKFKKPGKYKVYANFDLDINYYVDLQTGIIYPGFDQYPKTLETTRISNNYNYAMPTYIYIGEITLLENQELIQPVFIRLNNKININLYVKEIKIAGDSPIEYPYIEWWNQSKNTGMRPFQHANHITAISTINTIKNPNHLYREMIILKYHIHTYQTAINDPTSYMGLVFDRGEIIFSVWNSQRNNVDTPNKLIRLGQNVISSDYSNEGSGMTLTLKYNQYYKRLTLDNKYGFYNSFKVVGNNTEYSAYFIDLGPVDNPNPNPVWIYLGTILHYNTYTRSNQIGSFLENFITANGHLVQRCIALGNGWASVDGINWEPSTKEEIQCDSLNNQSGSIYSTPEAGLMKCCIGGRIGMENPTTPVGGNWNSYSFTRNIGKTRVPTHLKNITPVNL